MSVSHGDRLIMRVRSTMPPWSVLCTRLLCIPNNFLDCCLVVLLTAYGLSRDLVMGDQYGGREGGSGVSGTDPIELDFRGVRCHLLLFFTLVLCIIMSTGCIPYGDSGSIC